MSSGLRGISIDAAAPDEVRGIVGIGYGETLQDTEVCLDQVEARSVGGCPQIARSSHPFSRS